MESLGEYYIERVYLTNDLYVMTQSFHILFAIC